MLIHSLTHSNSFEDIHNSFTMRVNTTFAIKHFLIKELYWHAWHAFPWFLLDCHIL